MPSIGALTRAAKAAKPRARPAAPNLRPSGENLFDHTPVENSSQALIEPAVEKGQPRVVQSHEMQNRRVQVVAVDFILDGFVAELVGRAVMHAALHAAAGHPDGEAVRVVVSALGSLRITCGRTRRPR